MTNVFEGLRAMQAEVYRNAVDHGWHEKQRTRDEYLAISINNQHRELSEIWEAVRLGQVDAPCDKSEKMKAHGIEPLSCLEEELADVFIRLCDDAQQLGVDLAEAVRRKHQFNITREYRHGGKTC